MRPNAMNRRDTTAKKPSSHSWQRKGAAILAAIGLLGPSVATPAHAAVRHDPDTDTIVRTMATNCYALGNEHLDTVPGLRQMFNDLAAQPITGAPVIARLTNPAHRFQICLDRSLPSNGVMAAYDPRVNRLFVPATTLDLDSVAHEAFHAYQDTAGALLSADSRLSSRDAAIAHFLVEASAAAYSAAMLREMSLNNPALQPAYTAYISNRTNVYGQGRAFDAAFQAVYDANAALPEQERRRLALEAGGQTVVRNLMSGLGEGWRRGYVPRAATTAVANGSSDVNVNSRSYDRHRREIFTRAGAVGSNLQLVPANFYNANAVATAEFSLVALGLDIATVPGPEYRTPRGLRR